jgi:hypothetical protein
LFALRETIEQNGRTSKELEMPASRRTAVFVGVLFLTATATFMIGDDVLQSPILDAQDYLSRASLNRTRVILGVLIAFIDGLAIVGISVMLFPVLKRHGEAMALGYVGFRVTEFAVIIVYLVSALLLITLSQEYVTARDADISVFPALGALLHGLRYWIWQLVLLFNGIAGLMVTYLFYKSRLIPRPITILGIVGYAILLPGVFLDLLGVVDTGSGPGMAVFLPGAVFEAGLPMWLFVKGFNPSAIDSGSDIEDPAQSG